MPLPTLKAVAIDDDAADIELLRRYLGAVAGYCVELSTVPDPDAVDIAAIPQDADVVFLDYLLGEKTGLTVLRELRAAGIRLPVVVLTGQGDEHLAAELIKAGATDYLSKARLSPDSLEWVLRNALKVAELEREAALAAEKLRLANTVFENVLEGVMVTDASAVILSVNPAFSAITGYGEEEVVGQRPSLLKSRLHDTDFYQRLWATLLNVGQWKGEIWNRRKSGDTFLAWQTISAVHDSDGKTSHYVSVFFDITERKRREEQIRYQAYHDLLTGLPNRQLLVDRLTQSLLHAKREGEMLAVMFLDLDRFKEINDTQGHDMGDQVLQETARKLKSCVRKGDTVARLGGDEFVLLLPKIKQMDNVVHLAEKIIEQMGGTQKIGGQAFHTGASIGISMFPKDGDQADLLLKRADEAMYGAKQKGRGCYQLYPPAI
jgi:diguanylate cyclase (GGDEF)-like protein/PAS domain S-box-containing protein